MITRYWAFAPDRLWDLQWPAGLRLVDPAEDEEGRGCTRWWGGIRWRLFEDRDAPPELNGKRIYLTISRGRIVEDDPVRLPHITARHVIPW